MKNLVFKKERSKRPETSRKLRNNFTTSGQAKKRTLSDIIDKVYNEEMPSRMEI